MSLIIGIALGVAVGWLVPRPQWFDNALAKVFGEKK